MELYTLPSDQTELWMFEITGKESKANRTSECTKDFSAFTFTATPYTTHAPFLSVPPALLPGHKLVIRGSCFVALVACQNDCPPKLLRDFDLVASLFQK